jgi:hypothetical protein
MRTITNETDDGTFWKIHYTGGSENSIVSYYKPKHIPLQTLGFGEIFFTDQLKEHIRSLYYSPPLVENKLEEKH